MGCFTCGWRLYGEADIQKYVLEFNTQADLEAAKAEAEQRAQAEEEAKRIADAKRKRAALLAERKALQVRWSKGQKTQEPREVGMDPDLLLPIMECTEPGDLPKCAWPPCEKRSRENSKYCSRQCTVRVAHRRDRLRRKKLKKAS